MWVLEQVRGLSIDLEGIAFIELVEVEGLSHSKSEWQTTTRTTSSADNPTPGLNPTPQTVRFCLRRC